MKKIARADVRDESGLQSFWIGVSHFLHEGRSVVNDGTSPAVMLVVVNSGWVVPPSRISGWQPRPA